MEKRKLNGGMVGGGIGAFIGPVHRMAATMDGQAQYVAGAFSRDAEKSKKSGEELFLDPSRIYRSWEEMVEKESSLPVGTKIDYVSIVAPNVHHFPVAKAFLEAGINVVCDKPMTMTLAQAKELKGIVEKSGKVFALTHNYTGYPMVKQAKHMVESGEVGKINKIVVEYPQGWMNGFISSPGNAIGMWRMEPEVVGGSCCMGDLGTHAENLVRYITGLEIEKLCADLGSFVDVNKLEDDGNLLVRYKNGAKGILYASQISTGDENPFNIRIYGQKLGLYWNQEDPNYLWVKDPVGKHIRYSRGNDYLCDGAKENTRLPWGHPEGFIEAFANVYLEAFKAIRAEVSGKSIPKADCPNVDDGVMGLAFIETILESDKSDAKWTVLKQ